MDQAEPPPPDGDRCMRNGGKRWRCSYRRIDGESCNNKHNTKSKRSSFYSVHSARVDKNRSSDRDDGDGDERGEDLGDDERRDLVVKEKSDISDEVRSGKDGVAMKSGARDQNDEFSLKKKDIESQVKETQEGNGEEGNNEDDGLRSAKKQKKYNGNKPSKKENKGKDQQVKEKVMKPKKEENDSACNSEIELMEKRVRRRGKSADFGSVSCVKRNKGQKTQEKEMIEMEGDELESDDGSQCKGHGLRKRKSGETMEGPKRKSKYISDDPKDTFQMCHQCMKSDRKVVRCSKCLLQNKPKRYCLDCIRTWYPELSEEDIAEACPCCRKNCNFC